MDGRKREKMNEKRKQRPEQKGTKKKWTIKQIVEGD